MYITKKIHSKIPVFETKWNFLSFSGLILLKKIQSITVSNITVCRKGDYSMKMISFHRKNDVVKPRPCKINIAF